MIFIGFGSNIGEKKENISRAIALLREKGLIFLHISSLIETPAWGIEDQDSFINGVAEVAFSGSPHDLLRISLDTETKMGRKREIKWGPRLIDIDILEFHHLHIESPELSLPHPWYLKRNFVMIPLAEIAPDFVPLGESRTVKEIADQLPSPKA